MSEILKFFGAADRHACHHVAYRILCSVIVLLFKKKTWNRALDVHSSGSNTAEPTPCAHILSLHRSGKAPDKRLESVHLRKACDSESGGYWRALDEWRLRSMNFSPRRLSFFANVIFLREGKGDMCGGEWICVALGRRIGGRLRCCFIYTPAFTTS